MQFAKRTVSTGRTFTKVRVTFRPLQTREGHTDNDGHKYLNLSQLIPVGGAALPRRRTRRMSLSFSPSLALLLPKAAMLRRDYHWKIWSTEMRGKIGKLTPHYCRRKRNRNEKSQHVRLRRDLRAAMANKKRERAVMIDYHDTVERRSNNTATNRSSWLILIRMIGSVRTGPACLEKLVYLSSDFCSSFKVPKRPISSSQRCLRDWIFGMRTSTSTR